MSTRIDSREAVKNFKKVYLPSRWSQIPDGRGFQPPQDVVAFQHRDNLLLARFDEIIRLEPRKGNWKKRNPREVLRGRFATPGSVVQVKDRAAAT